jgi:hypothetical protein
MGWPSQSGKLLGKDWASRIVQEFQGSKEVPLIKPNGRCAFCDLMLKIPKTDHTYIRTKGYEKDYGGGKKIIRCPRCKKEQFLITEN